MPFQEFIIGLFQPAAGAEPFTNPALLIGQVEFGVYRIYDFLVGPALGPQLDGKLFERLNCGELR